MCPNVKLTQTHTQTHTHTQRHKKTEVDTHTEVNSCYIFLLTGYAVFLIFRGILVILGTVLFLALEKLKQCQQLQQNYNYSFKM